MATSLREKIAGETRRGFEAGGDPLVSEVKREVDYV